tara:strand:+ start:2760 stop:3044 length:285 start_codon:yes stop_codon:yes gene_type:complete
MISVFEKLGISASKWNKCIDNDFNQIEWTDGPQCTEEEFNNAKAELQADYDAKKYQRDRADAYDPIPEQLDQIFHDIDAWKARIKSVKDKYPKP